jgi:hypothetical protein
MTYLTLAVDIADVSGSVAIDHKEDNVRVRLQLLHDVHSATAVD